MKYSTIKQAITRIKILEGDNSKLRQRIEALYAGDLSPESRLAGYKVLVENMQKTIRKLRIDYAELQSICNKCGEANQ